MRLKIFAKSSKDQVWRTGQRRKNGPCKPGYDVVQVSRPEK